ncbi:pre-60S factor rei1 [Coemansia sp. RSA 552]|nr:pre-60S factor rei1 [Coemansia sp. RSA 552]
MDGGGQTTSGSLPTNGHSGPLFTCIACQVAFHSADQQRTHYRSDWHRYNLKRKVAGLPPVAAESFAQRVLAQQAQAAEDSKRAEFSAECDACKKVYGSENAFNNHIKSKKHKENEARMLRKMQQEEDLRAEQNAIAESIAASQNTRPAGAAVPAAASAGADQTDEHGCKVVDFPLSDDDDDDEEMDDRSGRTSPAPMDTDQAPSEADAGRARRRQERELRRRLDAATTEDEVVQLLETKRAAAPRLNPDSDCLFCTHQSDSFEANMSHMSVAHSLFVPDLEYVVDLRGLIKYLADKVSVANVCLFCNGRGRALHSLEAVRRHMVDKGHTGIAYETEVDILEISDFYDFSSTYPDADQHGADEELGGRAGDVVSAHQLEEEDGELILPNGNRIGHRSLQRYYKQTPLPERAEKDSVVIHKMLTSYEESPEYNLQVARASRNRAMVLSQPGGRHAWENLVTVKDKRMRENFKTRIGVRTNGLQKHYRDQNPI